MDAQTAEPLLTPLLSHIVVFGGAVIIIGAALIANAITGRDDRKE